MYIFQSKIFQVKIPNYSIITSATNHKTPLIQSILSTLLLILCIKNNTYPLETFYSYFIEMKNTIKV